MSGNDEVLKFIKKVFKERMEELKRVENTILSMCKQDHDWHGNLYIIRKTMAEYERYAMSGKITFRGSRITDIGEEEAIKEEKGKKTLH